MNKKIVFIFALILSILLIGCVSAGFFDFFKHGNDSTDVNVTEGGQYCTPYEVAAYIKAYHKLPSNFITKKQARDLGWKGGPLKDYAPGMSIGGDVFTNKQNVLPASDYKYIECDINANGTSRGAERIVYNTGDFKVYYTTDHYKTFREI